MENAAEALKMAAFVLLFVGALTIGILTLTKAKNTSEAIIYAQDEKNYYTFLSDSEIKNHIQGTNRIVTLDSIIPTLYRYYIEKFRVEFYDASNRAITLYTDSKGNKINYLDLESEQFSSEFLGSQQKAKENVDTIVSNLMNSYKDRKFVEKLGIEYEEDDSSGIPDINKTEKRTIRYILKN